MSEPRYVSPMLDGFSLGQSISEHNGVACYPAMRDDSEKRYIVKKISLPASQVQVEALLLTGVFRDSEAVRAYYEELAQGIRKEVQVLETLAGQRGFVPYNAHQIEPLEDGVGYDVILLSRYRKTLDRFMERSPMTHLSAVNLGIDMCAALAVCREAGWLYVDLKPQNIHMFEDQEYRIGDLGFMPMDMLAYSSLPERYRSIYTAPEVADAYSTLNTTMDTYSLGLILYQVYNQGKLPFDSAEERTQWAARLSEGEGMAAPVCADEEMTAIIAKAIAPDPAQRWQTPAEMGHALISYMQRNGADDIPLVLPEPEEEPAEQEPAKEEMGAEEPSGENPVEETPAETVEEVPQVEQSVEEAVEEAPVVEESVEKAVEAISVVEEPVSEISETEPEVEQTLADTPVELPQMEEIPEEAPAEAPAAEEAPGEAPETEDAPDEDAPDEDADSISADWIDLMDAFLAEEGDVEDPDADEPSLRQLLGDEEEYLSDAEDLSEEDVSAETADFLNFAQELIEHEAPAPVTAPEPIDIPIPAPIPLEDEEEEAMPDLDISEEEEPEEAAEQAPPAAPVPPEAAPKSGIWKKILGTVAALAVAAGLGFGAWYYYQNIYLQPISAMSHVGSAREVTVTVETPMDQSQLTVICKDTYGNAVTGTLENGQVTFTELVPGSQYIISLEPKGFHKLTGSTSVTYFAPAETKIMHLTAVTGQEAGSVILSFGVEGMDSEEWTVTYSAEDVQPQSVAFTGHTVTITGLTVGTDYTFTLSAPEEILLVGENTISHTASDLIQASNLALAGFEGSVLTVTWNAPEGVDRWIVRCFDGADYDQLQEVTGNTAAFEGVTEGTKYTLEVTAASQTLAVRSEITADSNNISGLTATQSGSVIELTWNYGGAIPEGGWKIAWSADGGSEQFLTAEENKATFSPAAPGSSYTFTIQSPEGSSMAPASTTLDTPAAGTFSANKLDSESIIVELFDVPTKSGWGYSALLRAKEKDSFKAGGSMALLYTVTKPYSFDDTEFETLFVIRDSEGKLVSTSARTRSWDDMWDNGYCTEQLIGLPAVQGSYTLSIYIENGLLAQLPFTVK